MHKSSQLPIAEQAGLAELSVPGLLVWQNTVTLWLSLFLSFSTFSYHNMSNSKKGVYDEDDYYDYEDADEDYYGGYAGFDPGESQVAGKQSAKVFDNVQQAPQ